METSSYILIGGGEHARVVLDVLLSNHTKVNGLFDPKYSGELFGVPQMGDYSASKFPTAKAIVGIGNNTTRKKAIQFCKHTFGNAFHSSAIISSFAKVDEGTVIFHKCVVQANTKIGKHVILNTGAQIDHDCIIGDYVHLAPSATLCGTVEVGEGTLVGAGATIIPGIKIGKWAVVAAGAVVTQNIPDFALVAGVPAVIKKINSPI